ncbi:hypothetical protein LCGC14_1519320 [marine sediment metagenome]|uniref:Uncharacterized protein n=1 Tax=marine sediment metagenome TaxID=412755 RepID=A0A0F9M067_9ZZZZ
MDNKLKLISEFQCSGCMRGGPTTKNCNDFSIEEAQDYFRCASHVCGTTALTGMGFVNFALGLPNGFNRGGPEMQDKKERWANTFLIRIWSKDKYPDWDKFNIPVWAMEKDGFLFVRTFMPRINRGCTDVIEQGNKQKLCPLAIDVGEFYDEID